MIPVSTVSADDATAARRKAFVDAAREGFFANGYAGTTMSSIASTVGGSKTTLWSYFPSKEALFEAVVDDIVDYYGAALQVELPVDEDVLPDRKSVVSGKSVSVRVALGGRRIIKKKTELEA